MIATPTTFVIGAGGSCVYGLPTGTELLREAQRLKPESDAYQLILQSSVTLEELNKFITEIADSPLSSIDAFLETRQTEATTMKTGKAVMAVLLGKRLAAGLRTLGEDEDWLKYIIQKMATNAPSYDSFDKGNMSVRFVTFNFDTIIENRLNQAIHRIFKTGEFPDDRIIHVHGKLPPIPSDRISQSELAELYGERFPRKWVDWVQTAASQIHVVTDEIDSTVLQAAREAVRQTNVVVFLGFGYDPRNLERLGYPAILQKESDYSTPVFGSAYGLLAGERDTIENRFLVIRRNASVIRLGREDWDCRTVLRTLPWFRD